MGTAGNLWIEENLSLALRRGKKRGLQWQITGDEKYLDSALKSWAYIKAEIINGPAGEWFASGKNSPDEENSHLLCGPWKCPYHNARAAFEIYERCEALEK